MQNWLLIIFLFLLGCSNEPSESKEQKDSAALITSQQAGKITDTLLRESYGGLFWTSYDPINLMKEIYISNTTKDSFSFSISISSEEGPCSGKIEGRASYLNDSMALFANGICSLRFLFRNADTISLTSNNCKTSDATCSFSDQYHRVLVNQKADDYEENLGVFEGTYDVGTATCNILHSKMSYELRWVKGSQPIQFFYKRDAENGEKIFEGENGDQFRMKPDFKSGLFIRADGKEVAVLRKSSLK